MLPIESPVVVLASKQYALHKTTLPYGFDVRIVLLHPAHTSIGSRVPRESLPPYGLLCIGGPLIDAGHEVTLVNADPLDWNVARSVSEVLLFEPDAVLIGHSGSTSAHPTVVELALNLKKELPKVKVIYGGVYPTYHWEEILSGNPAIDLIVRGEGEETTRNLIEALEDGSDLSEIRGIAFRRDGVPFSTVSAAILADLDAHRIGWELIDHSDYSYWGGRRAVIMQFSRGCPHLCTYCGQRGFWTRWRHRDPVAFAAEIARMYREHGVELVSLADENPTTSPKAWRAFLDAMIAEDVPVTIIGSTRADDIVRDAKILHLYRRAGVLRFLMGYESTDEQTLENVRKGGSRPKDREAIRLLRENGMIGLITFAVGFEEETGRDHWRTLRTLLSYDPDQTMSVFATPHAWTPFFSTSAHRRVVQTDQRYWDYKHQVMEVRGMAPWRVLLWVRFIELVLQIRPKSLWRTFLHPDPEIRYAMRWYMRLGSRVVRREIWSFIFREKRTAAGPTVAEYLRRDVPMKELAMERQPRVSVE